MDRDSDSETTSITKVMDMDTVVMGTSLTAEEKEQDKDTMSEGMGTSIKMNGQVMNTSITQACELAPSQTFHIRLPVGMR